MRQKDIPKELLINGELWTIRFVKKIVYGKGEILGLTDPSTRTISIIQKLNPKLRAEIYFHELMHAICFEYNFDIAHKHIYKIGEGLGQVHIDNFF